MLALMICVTALNAAGTGHLAVADLADGPWRLPPETDEMPADCWLRASSFGPVRIRTKLGALQLAPDSLGRWNGELRLQRGAARWENTGAVVFAPGADRNKQHWAKMEEAAQAVGELVVHDVQSGTAHRLNLSHYHVHVALRAPAALVQIDQGFYNPFDRQQEGTFLFNLPAGASVSRFAMYVTPEDLVEGEIVARDRATQVYESIVRSMRDPAILEQVGENQFRMRVFPIPAHDVKRILLDYTVPLVPVAGRCRFRLPLFSDLEPIGDFKLSGRIDGTAGLLSFSSEPALPFRRIDATSVGFELAARNHRPPAEAAIHFQPPGLGREPVVYAYRAENRVGDAAGRTYFAALLPPMDSPAIVAEALAPPTDVLVLASTAGRVRERDRLRQFVRTAARHLRSTDRLRIACVDASLRPLCNGWLAPGLAETESALAQLDDQSFLGAADVPKTLEEALDGLAKDPSNRRKVVLYVGGDYIRKTSLGERGWIAQAQMAEALGKRFHSAKASFFAVRVDEESESGDAWMRALTNAAGGRLFSCAATEPAEREFFRDVLVGLPAPLLVESVATSLQAAIAPTVWEAGRPLEVYGVAANVPIVDVLVRLQRDGRSFERVWNLPLSPKSDDMFVGRLWAQAQAQRLRQEELAAIAAEMWRPTHSGFPPPQKQQQIDLAVEWGLITPHTAHLVLESEAEYARYGIDRAKRRRYWEGTNPPRIERPAVDWVGRPSRTAHVADDPGAFARVVFEAKASLKQGDALRAQVLLVSQQQSRLAQSDPEFRATSAAVRKRLAEKGVLADLGPLAGLVDRTRAADDLRLDVWPLLAGGVHKSFQALHPHAEALMRTVEPPQDQMPIREFLAWVESQAGAPVIEDVEGGKFNNVVVRLRGLRRLTLRNLIAHALEGTELRIRDEPFGLVVCDKVGRRMETRVTPANDLLRNEAVTDASLLSHPYLDVDRAADARLRTKLNRPISLDVQTAPLFAVADQIADALGENVRIDRDGADATPITLRLQNIPARQALELLCRKFGGEFSLGREAIVLKAEGRGSMSFDTRVYPVAGLVREWTVDLPPDPQGRPAPDPDDETGSHRFGLGGGGIGGGGGGLGGAVGGAREASGGDDTSTQRTNAGISAPLQSAGRSAGPARPAVEPPLPEGFRRVFVNDSGRLLQTIANAVDRDGWEMNGGDATIVFSPSLDFVVAAPEPTHRQLDELLETLRALPAATPFASAPRRPAVRRPPQSIRRAEVRLGDLITKAVSRETWESNGGDSTLDFVASKEAMVCRAERDVHEQTLRLLTELRRSRYSADHSDRPWERIRPLFRSEDALTTTALGAMDSEKSTGTTAAALRLAKIRREPAEVAEKWAYYRGRASVATMLSLQRRGRRMDAELRNAAFRIEFAAKGPAAAVVVYPRLGVGERGRFGDVLLRLADVALPWLPHRDDADLAGRFSASLISENDKETTLRFALPTSVAVIADVPPARAFLLATFSRESGLPIAWECRLREELQYRLKFSGRARDSAGPFWRSVAAFDRNDQPLERWELRERKPLQTALADVNSNWPGYVFLSGADQSGADALAAVRREDFVAAQSALAAALSRQPGMPFLHFLRAWRRFREAPLGQSAEAKVDLEVVANSRADDLTRFLIHDNLVRQPPAALLAALSRRPAAERNSTDEIQLAELALAASDAPLALTFFTAAKAKSVQEDAPLPIRAARLGVELLLRTARSNSAEQEARALAAASPDEAEEISQLADLLAKHNRPECASDILDLAWRRPTLSPHSRTSLLRQRAGLASGTNRLSILLAGRLLLPEWAGERETVAISIEDALRSAPASEETLRILHSVPDARLRARLLYFAATAVPRFQVDEDQRGDLCSAALETGALAEAEVEQIAHVLAALAKVRPALNARATIAFEKLLRSPAQSTAAEFTRHRWIPILEELYRAANRMPEAARARSELENG